MMSTSPLRVYLDQNKWVDLARARTGHPEGNSYRDALSALERSVQTGTAVIPLSLVHLIEVSHARKARRRQHLSDVMTQLSQGKRLIPFHAALPLEIEELVLRYVERDFIPVKEQAIGTGIEFTTGLPVLIEGPDADNPATREAIMKILDSEESFNRLLAEVHSGEGEKGNSHEGFLLMEERRRRARNDGITKKTLLLHNQAYVYKYMFFPGLMDALVKHGVSLAMLAAGPEPKIGSLERLMSVPTLDMSITMLVEQDYDWNRRLTSNEVADRQFLSTAVPYCDVVVTDKYWHNILHRSGLGARYHTEILTDLREVIPLLGA